MRHVTGISLVILLVGLAFPALASDWNAFKALHPKADLVYDQVYVAPRLLDNFAEPVPTDLDPKGQAVVFLNRHRAAFGIQDAATEFVATPSQSLGERRLVRLRQHVNGVPVLNGTVHVLLNRAGEVVRVHNHYSPAARDLTTIPVVTRAEAISTAWASVYHASTYDISDRARAEGNAALYVWALGDAAHLVYVVALPTGLLTEKRIALIDAHSGAFLMQRNLVVYRKANAFTANPGSDGSLPTSEVDLLDILDVQDGDAIHTVSDLVRAVNCPDEGEIREINIGITLNVPMCTEKHLAVADENGDFLYTPVMAAYSNVATRADEFSEVHLYHHVTQAYHFFQDLARHIDDTEPPFETLNQLPLQAVANFKMPDLGALMGGGTVSLVPFDNAFFVPKFGIIPDEYPEQDAIVFGQGTYVDFAYDGEVVYHEFTHAMIETVISLGSIIGDQYGLATDPGAINEGYADYFAATLSGDPNMAEFLGASFQTGESESLRNLTNTKKCPDDVHGEVHDDSEWFSAALWELRQEFKVSDEDHWDIDAAIYSALLELPSEASFTVAANATLDQMQAWFGNDAKAFAQEVFTRRGLINCNRAVPISDGFTLPRISIYDSNMVSLTPYVPGFMQFHASLPDGGRGIRMTFRVQSGGGIFGGGTISMDVLARHGEPVTFMMGRSVTATNDWQVPVKKVSSENNVDTYEAILTNPDNSGLASGEWYFAFAVKSAGGGMMSAPMLYHLTFSWGCDSDEDCAECKVCGAGGQCEDPVSECESDDDCTPMEACVEDGCIMVCQRRDDACVTARDCGDCQSCVGGVCMDIATECTDNEECEEGETCVIEGCVGTCTLLEDGDAPDGDVPDGDLPEDGDEAPGPGAAGGSGGCQQGAPMAGWGLVLLGLALVFRRRRA